MALEPEWQPKQAELYFLIEEKRVGKFYQLSHAILIG